PKTRPAGLSKDPFMSKLPALALAGVFALALSVASCGARSSCTVANCDGCCSPNGRCNTGNTAAACGHGGFDCNTCVTPAQKCDQGACVSSAGGGSGQGGGSGIGGGGTAQ